MATERSTLLVVEEGPSPSTPPPLTSRLALQFVVLLGFCSLFADLTYEGARSVSGPYLALLGSSATAVGVVVGSGEFIGYSFRFVSGYATEKSGFYWGAVFLGYIVTVASVCLLSVASTWQQVVALLVGERLGHGRGFGIHQFMDQVGAVAGPIIVSAVISWKISLGDEELISYKAAFAVLVMPGILAIMALAAARWLFPHPQDLETTKRVPSARRLRQNFWVFVVGNCFMAAGYIDFPLYAYHFHKAELFGAHTIPLMYSTAMAVEAVTALAVGTLFDQYGISAVAIAIGVASLSAPLMLLGARTLVWAGIICWGLGMGVQGAAVSAIIADIVPAERRSSAYGIANGLFGISWALGSALLGYLYDALGSPLLVATTSLGLEALAILTLLIAFIR